ncbi:MAG: hypothetical protein AAF372_03635 [Pseudomonadota bacterium]
MKKVLIGLVVLILIIAAGIYYVLGNLDSIVEHAIEKYGSEALKTSVEVGSVNIKLTEGLAQINDLEIDNPKGFKTDYLFYMGTTRVQLDVKRISSELIVIKEVLLDGPSINYELSMKGSNVETLIKNMGSSSSGGSSDSGSSSGGSGPKLIIENFIFKDGEVVATSNVVKDKTLKTKLPKIHMTNLGGSSGATPEEITKQVMNELLKEIAKAAKNLDLSSLMNEEMLKELGKGKLNEASGGALEKLEGEGGGAVDKLKKLF